MTAVNGLNLGLQLTIETVVRTAPKLFVNGQLIFSKHAVRVKKRNSYTVAYYQPGVSKDIKYGQIEKFVSFSPNGSLNEHAFHIALIEPLAVQPPADLMNLKWVASMRSYVPVLFNDFVALRQMPQSSITAIMAENILMKCFNTSTHGQLQITSIVNYIQTCLYYTMSFDIEVVLAANYIQLVLILQHIHRISRAQANTCMSMRQ